MMPCAFCGGKSQYRDRQTGQYLCLEHSRLEVVAPKEPDAAPPLTIRAAVASDHDQIEELSLYFWDETVVDCFDRQYDVLACPAFLACNGDKAVGMAAYAVEREWDAVVLVILNVLPDYQGCGAGRMLLDAIRGEALRQGLRRLFVVTSNDDLPALALYQKYGFFITKINPGRIALEHGGEFPGLAGIPVRDEIQLACKVSDW